MSSDHIIQLTRQGTRCAADLVALRQEFEAKHALRLPQLLSAGLMDKISDRLEHGAWVEEVHPQVNRELLLNDHVAWSLLHFVASTPSFLAIIRQITCCGTATDFRGRVYRMLPGPAHQVFWHNDVNTEQGRLVGMSINLGPRPYSGGVFQLRRQDSTDLLCELPNTVPGDAILFRISPDLKHRVTAVEGLVARTAFAGWFTSTGVDLLSTIRQQPYQATTVP